MTKPVRLLVTAGWCACVCAAEAVAAGGHFDVDDAAIVEPGHCQVETWWTRAPAASATLLHLGPACRIGPVELGVNVERLVVPTEARTALGPQLKWVAGPFFGALGAGIAWSALRDPKRGGRHAHTVYVPLTWAPADSSFAFNANLGGDWDLAGAHSRRIGASAEWAAHEKLTLIAERVRFAGDWTSRLGARFSVNDATSVDLSVARVGPNAARVYVIGLNHDFAR